MTFHSAHYTRETLTHAHTHLQTHTHLYTNNHTHTYTSKNIQTHAAIHIHTNTHLHIHTNKHLCTEDLLRGVIGRAGGVRCAFFGGGGVCEGGGRVCML